MQVNCADEAPPQGWPLGWETGKRSWSQVSIFYVRKMIVGPCSALGALQGPNLSVGRVETKWMKLNWNKILPLPGGTWSQNQEGEPLCLLEPWLPCLSLAETLFAKVVINPPPTCLSADAKWSGQKSTRHVHMCAHTHHINTHAQPTALSQGHISHPVSPGEAKGWGFLHSLPWRCC